MSVPPFDPDFGSPRDIAAFYLSKGLQPLPANGKQPAVRWKDYQNAPLSVEVFEGWYDPVHGAHKDNGNVGTLLGKASHEKFMVDLDVYKEGGEAATNWYNGQLAIHNNRQELETWEQITGGKGRQLFFECPPGWTPPNVTTNICVDVKGQGGFAILPPSRHSSGALYKWREGRSPDDIDILVAPQWLCDEIDRLGREHGGVKPRPDGGNGHARVVPSSGVYNEWGRQTDLREDKMFKMVFAVVRKWYLELNGVEPFPPDWEPKSRAEYAIYEAVVEPTISQPGKSKAELLDMQERGWVEWHEKFKRCMGLWYGKIAEEAGKPSPRVEINRPQLILPPKIDPITGEVLPLLLTAEQFLRGFVPPDYLIDGVIQKSYLYSLTARTGHGKTAIAMLKASCVARGVVFHGHPTAQGNVLFLAGENPQDVRARYKVLADSEQFAPESTPFYFVDGVIDIAASLPKIREEAAKIGDLALVVVDTAAAYFRGDDSNSNVQQGLFAQLLRQLIKLPGAPAVIVNCHPVKNATQDNLIPLGGSNFINEVDGNLTLWAEDKTCVLHHHPAKWRGSPFEQLEFELRTVVSDTVKDTKGRHMPSVVAVPITEQGAERRGAVAEADENTVLGLIHTHKNASMSEIARKSGFVLPNGLPSKAKVQRIIERLKISKMVYKYRGSKYKLTKKGCKEIGVKQEQDDDEQ